MLTCDMNKGNNAFITFINQDYVANSFTCLGVVGFRGEFRPGLVIYSKTIMIQMSNGYAIVRAFL